MWVYGVSCIPTTDSMNQQQQAPAPQVVACGHHLFRIVNGQRHWITEPPAEWLEQAQQDQQQGGRHV